MNAGNQQQSSPIHKTRLEIEHQKHLGCDKYGLEISVLQNWIQATLLGCCSVWYNLTIWCISDQLVMQWFDSVRSTMVYFNDCHNLSMVQLLKILVLNNKLLNQTRHIATAQSGPSTVSSRICYNPACIAWWFTYLSCIQSHPFNNIIHYQYNDTTRHGMLELIILH